MSSLVLKLKCALCGGAIDLLDDFFRASGDFLPAQDPLVTFCNVPLHWSCYARWPERARFAQAYVEAWIHANRRNPFWWSVYRDEHVYISVNPERSVEEVSVRLFAVGSDIRVPLAQWSAWLDDAGRLTPELRPLELDVLNAVLPTLRQRFPDDHAVVHAINTGEKRSEPAPARRPRGQRAPARVAEG
jgi:hypothetical protein